MHWGSTQRSRDRRWLLIGLIVVLVHVGLLTMDPVQPIKASLGAAKFDAQTGIGGAVVKVISIRSGPTAEEQRRPELTPSDRVVQLASVDPRQSPPSLHENVSAPDPGTTAAPSPAHYYWVEEVDTSPVVPDELDYGQLEVDSWRLTVRLWVSAAGQVDHAEIYEAYPPGNWSAQVLRSLALATLKPASLAGVAVPVQMNIQLGPEVVW